eukprot:341491_1
MSVVKCMICYLLKYLVGAFPQYSMCCLLKHWLFSPVIFSTKKCDFDIVLPPPLIQQNNDTKSNKVKPTKIKQTNKRPRTPSSSFENDKITKHKLKTMETV